MIIEELINIAQTKRRSEINLDAVFGFSGDKNLLRVKAILWMVLPNVRKDALLTNQAKLINMFKV